ncbi:MAG: MFS transporter [Rhabdochlamydiaceae bacterium]
MEFYKRFNFFKKPLFGLFLTVFVDSLGFGLVFPILSGLITDPNSHFLSEDVSLAFRGLIFGGLVSIYAIGQFFGGPLLGRWSDIKGRKKILVLSMWVSFFCYFLGGLGVFCKSLIALLLSRLFGGIAAGNHAIVQSIVVDQVEPEQRAQNFGMINMVWGTGFIMGPLVGGYFSQIDFMLPFWIATGVAFVNAVTVHYSLKETHQQLSTKSFDLWEGLLNIKKGFNHPTLKSLFGIMFLFSLGWSFFTEFSPLLLTQRIGLKTYQVSHFYAYIGIWIALSQGILIRPFLKRFSPEWLLKFGWIGLGLTLPLMLLCREFNDLLWVVPLTVFPESLICPASSVIVSNAVSKEHQGETLGIHNSIQWAATGLAPLFSGSLVALYPHLPVTVCTFFTFVCVGLFSFIYKTKVVSNDSN